MPDMRRNERLGRRISEGSREVRRIKQNIAEGKGGSLKNIFTYRIFKPRKGETRISMDRLDLKPIGETASIAKQYTDRIGRPLYGWAVVIYQFVIQAGFTVTLSPTDENPCHVDLNFPTDIQGRDDEKLKAHELLDSAEWLDCPK